MQLMTQFEWTITGLQASDFKEAVCWYNYSLSIFPLQEGGSGVAKLQVGSSVTFGSVCCMQHFFSQIFELTSLSKCSCVFSVSTFQTSTCVFQNGARVNVDYVPPCNDL